MDEKRILDSIGELFPIEVDNKRLEANNIRVEGASSTEDIPGQKAARETNKTYGNPIFADIVFYENDKKIETKKRKIGIMPIISKVHTYIIDGSEYQVNSMLRLRPGVYTRLKQNGELESMFNVKGIGFRIQMNPKTNMFYMRIRQANVKLLPILKILGANDSDIRSIWGNKIFEKNTKVNHTAELKKLYKILFSYKPMLENKQEIGAELIEHFNASAMDSEVNKITLGKAFGSVTAEALLASTDKMIKVYKKETEVDDRDDLAFKSIHKTEDFIVERIERQSRMITSKLKRSLRKNGEIGKIIHAGIGGKPIKSFFTQSQISEQPQQINTLNIENAKGKVTLIGEGGIQNMDQITDSARNLSPSHIGFLDPLHTPESKKVGITLNTTISSDTRDNRLTTEVYNIRTKDSRQMTHMEMRDIPVALPGEIGSDKKMIRVVLKGKQVTLPRNQVNHSLSAPFSAFTLSTNVVPFINHDEGSRASMATRHTNQAVSLVDREAPLVIVEAGFSGASVEEGIGRNSQAVFAPDNGTIISITKDEIVMENDLGKTIKIPMFDHYPMANKSTMNNTTVIKKGAKVRKGQLLAESSFTKDGILAISKPLKTGYMTWKGLTFEDGIVVSESAAKKLTSEHLHQKSELNNATTVYNKKKWIARFPAKYSTKQLNKIGENGLAKKGVILEPGDPYLLSMRESIGSPEDLALGKLHKTLLKPFKDISQEWGGATEGKVTSSVLTGKDAKVYIMAHTPATTGDKLSGRHGNKGVISAIIPDSKMPHNKNGEALEVIFNPIGVTGRTNPGQLLEAVAGKIAKERGEPYLVRNFAGIDHATKMKAELKELGMAEDGTEELFDPSTGESVGRILTGYPGINKIFKTTEGNFSARERGSYDLNRKPVKGGKEGAKAVDLLSLYSMLSMGSRYNLRDASTYKGEMSQEAWQAVMNGMPLPAPKTPFAYKKFEAMLKGAGINVNYDGTKRVLGPMTDKDIDKVSGGRSIKNMDMLDGNLQPKKGGLFDSQLTGGTHGERWSKIELGVDLPSPMFESAIKKLTRLTAKDYNTIISGKKELDGETGFKAIKKALSFDVDEELKATEMKIKTSSSKTTIAKETQRLKLLKALKRTKMSATEAYMTSKVAVIPPSYRPVFELPNGSLTQSPANMLYRDVGNAAESRKLAEILPDEDKGAARQNLYDAVKAMQGIGSPITDTAAAQDAKGFMEVISGGTPKTGFYQNKVLRKTQDLTGRSTVILDTKLNMDEVGIPKEMAKKIFRPFAVRELVRQGYNPKRAQEQIDDLTPIGKKAIEAVMAERPVIFNRAPTLHKFNVSAYKGVMIDGKSLSTGGQTVGPQSLDFDGDTATVHVPFTEEARKESWDMLPSKQLFLPLDSSLSFVPKMEAVHGIWEFTKTSEGRNKLAKIMGVFVTKRVDGKELKHLLAVVAKKTPEKYPFILESIKRLGDDEATKSGFSFTLDDLSTDPSVAKAYTKADIAINKLKNPTDAQKIKIYQAAEKEFNMSTSNNFTKTVISGALSGSKIGGVKKMINAPGLMLDNTGSILPDPVRGNYSRGMDFGDYFTALYGSRKGTYDKALATAGPGAFSKEVNSTVINQVISMLDCGTTDGITLKRGESNGRYLAGSHGRYRHNDLISSTMDLPSEVTVRSPITCKANEGLCSYCYGHNENGELPKIGDHVGLRSAQALTEPLTQAAMRTFHTGGTASGASSNPFSSGFDAVKRYMELPKIFPGEATLAERNGQVTSVRSGDIGDHIVYINGQEHYIAPMLGTPTVKVGDTVKRGQQINEGVVNPRKVTELLGGKAGRIAMTDLLKTTFSGAGINANSKHIETVVKAMGGYGVVTDSKDDDKFVEGDVAPISVLEERGLGFKNSLIGVNLAPTESGDWLSQLSYRYIKKGLQDGALYGDISDTESFNPIPAYVTGTIGYNKGGRY